MAAGRKKYPAPTPGALDEEVVFNVTVRVTLRGNPEALEAQVRARFERDLRFMFPNDPHVVRVGRAAR